MNDQAVTTTTDDALRIEYEGRPLESFDKPTLIAMIADLVSQLDAANEALTTAERQIERLRATVGKGFSRGR
jgi:hypothetical protein